MRESKNQTERAAGCRISLEQRRRPRFMPTRNTASAASSSKNGKKKREKHNSVMFCRITGSASRTLGQLLTRGVICHLAASHFVGLSSSPRILVITCTVFVYRGLLGARQRSVIMEKIIKQQQRQQWFSNCRKQQISLLRGRWVQFSSTKTIQTSFPSFHLQIQSQY